MTAFISSWEQQHYPDLKDVQLPPRDMPAHCLEARDVSAYRLVKDLGVSQGNSSAVLHGKRGISKGLAKKLAEYFGVSLELFIWASSVKKPYFMF